ncbi:type IV pilus assembly protein PilM [Patescibacteria group bacterium]
MDFFGLDIGSHSLKIAQVERKKEAFRLLAFGSVMAPQRGLLSEAEADLTALAGAIKKLHREAKIRTKNVATALPEDKVFSKLLSFPKMAEKELKSAIKWEAEQYVPIPLEEVILDHQIIGETKENNEGKVEILIVAAPKNLVEKTLRILRMAGFTPVSLESEIMALSRSLTTVASAPTLLVDLGARATDMAIVEKGKVIFTRSIPTGGEALTRAVASSLNLKSSQAEEYKKAYGANPALLEGKILGAIGPIFNSLIVELEKALQFFGSKRNQKIERIILAGGSSVMPELVVSLAQHLNLEVQIGDPFARLEKGQEAIVQKIPPGLIPTYATAIGLALKKIS